MRAITVIRLLDETSSGQWGLLTTAQASRVGVSRLALSRLASSGHLVRLAYGVYRCAGSPPPDYEDIRAAWLSTDPAHTAEERLADRSNPIVIGGTAATYLHGIGDFYPEPYLFVTRTRRQSQRPDVRFKTQPFSCSDATIVAGLPVSSVEQTLAELVRDNQDLSLVTDALREAMDLRKVDISTLRERLAPLSERNSLPINDGGALLNNLLGYAMEDS